MSIPSVPSRRSAAAWLALAAMLGISACDTGAPPLPQAGAGTDAAAAAGDRTGRFDGFAWRLTRAKAGSPLPASILTGPDGDERRLSPATGKPLLVNLWASWCAPCIAELPALQALAQGSDGAVDVAAVSLDTDRETACAFLEQRGIDALPLWHDGDGTLLGLAGAGLPTTILYDARGREVWRVIGGFDWKGSEAASLIAEASRKGSPAP